MWRTNDTPPATNSWLSLCVLFIDYTIMTNFSPELEGITWVWKTRVDSYGFKEQYRSALKQETIVPVRQARFANDGITCRGAY